MKKNVLGILMILFMVTGCFAGSGQQTADVMAKEVVTVRNVQLGETANVSAVKQLPEYTVTAFEQQKTMYATTALNVRKGPGVDYGKIGALKRAQEVSVTGQADTGWYEIAYGDGKAYVSNQYIAEEMPRQAPVKSAATGAGVVLVGDSRFVEMQSFAGENSCVWIAERGKGYKWLEETAMPSIDGAIGNGTKVLINLGVNDPGNHQKYIALINAKAEEWVSKGAKVYYASVNPVWENPHVTKEQVEYFNSQLVGGLSGNVQWIDSYSYLNTIGFKLVDGLHFNAETYQNLYTYYMSCL